MSDSANICCFCNLNFQCNTELVCHTRSMHPLQTAYKCSDCNRKFSTFDSFKSHRYKEHKKSSSNLLDDNFNDNFDAHFNDNFDDNLDVDISENSFPGISTHNNIETSEETDFDTKLNNDVQKLMSCSYGFSDMSDKRVFDFFNAFSKCILQGSAFQNLQSSVLTHLEALNDSPMNISKFRSMFELFGNPFHNCQSQYLQKKLLHELDFFVKPETFKIGERDDFKEVNGIQMAVPVPITAQFISLRALLKTFFEVPNVLKETLEYQTLLRSHENIISNFMQGEFWRELEGKFWRELKDKCWTDFDFYYINPNTAALLPLFIYFDEYETDDALGSHAGLAGKVGAVYASCPSVPEKYQAKLENIFITMLFNVIDRKNVEDAVLFSKLIDELNFLQDEGIKIKEGNNTEKTVYFKFVLLLGDNLGLNSLFGFNESFTSNYFCRFCLVLNKNKHKIFNEKGCTMRNKQNYEECLRIDNPSLTGMKRDCIFHKVKDFHVTVNRSVDGMHDLEGVIKYDVSKLLHIFINEKKYFNLSLLNARLNGFPFDDNDKRNRPPSIEPNHLKQLTISHSTSEIFCFLRILPLLIGDLIPENDPYFQILIKLRHILEIVFALKHHKDTYIILEIHIEEYLKLLVSLNFHLRPKHHLLLHYATVMKKMGPLGKISSMRYEAKHRVGKAISKVSTSRKNICLTIASRHQQIFQKSLQNMNSVALYETAAVNFHQFPSEIPNYFKFYQFLPSNNCNNTSIHSTKCITYLGKKIKKGKAILIIPNECGYTFLRVENILLCPELLIIGAEINGVIYNEHFDVYEIIEDIEIEHCKWSCVSIENLQNCFVTYSMSLSSKKYIIKKWII